MPLHPESLRQLVLLVRENVHLRAEVKSLQAILTAAELENRPPVDWVGALMLLRQQIQYRELVGQDEPLLRRLEDAADVEECLRLLSEMSSAETLN